ncbi:MAG: hypothetical protein HC781_21450 [Leptolyngbyaceae cyanobacterium CSU_1_4]|nr:hypothetical protein [Leptolyngbyaceae cyanobacterium CSU_1_4]
MVYYQADCLLWTGLEFGVSENVRVYTTPEIARRSLFGGSELGGTVDPSVPPQDRDRPSIYSAL